MDGKVAVLGAGSWATALSVLLGKKGIPVTMWARRAEAAVEINTGRENKKYLPGVSIPGAVSVTADIAEALKSVGFIVMGVPSHAFRETLRLIRPLITGRETVVNTAKGLEEGSLIRLSEVFAEEMPAEMIERFTILTGPSHAEEVGREIPTTVVVAGRRQAAAEAVQDLFMSPRFRVYTNPDVIGVETGGALKNVIAICTGVSDGLGFGDNAKAALITRGLAEISRLGVAMGGKPLTFSGLAGVGDLVVTCTSMHSRNRRAGMEIGRGIKVNEAIESVQMVVEGFRTTRVAYQLAQKHQVCMPITDQAYRVLFEGLSPLEAVTNLMMRSKTHEMEEVVDAESGDADSGEWAVGSGE